MGACRHCEACDPSVIAAALSFSALLRFFLLLCTLVGKICLFFFFLRRARVLPMTQGTPTVPHIFVARRARFLDGTFVGCGPTRMAIRVDVGLRAAVHRIDCVIALVIALNRHCRRLASSKTLRRATIQHCPTRRNVRETFFLPGHHGRASSNLTLRPSPLPMPWQVSSIVL